MSWNVKKRKNNVNLLIFPLLAVNAMQIYAQTTFLGIIVDTAIMKLRSRLLMKSDAETLSRDLAFSSIRCLHKCYYPWPDKKISACQMFSEADKIVHF